MKTQENKKEQNSGKKRHTLLWVSLVLVLIGLAMSVAGLMSGAEKTISWRGGRPRIERMVMTDASLPKSVHTLDVTASGADLTIKRGNRFAVDSSLVNRRAKVEVKDGVATISGVANRDYLGISLSFSNAREKLTVTVPEGQKLTLVKVNVKFNRGVMSNESRISQLTADNVEVKNTSWANIIMERMTVHNKLTLDFNGGDGSISQVKAKNLTANLNSSYFDVEGLAVAGQSSLHLQHASFSMNNTNNFRVVSVLRDAKDHNYSSLRVENRKKIFPYLNVQEQQEKDAKAKEAQAALKVKMAQVQALAEQQASLRAIDDKDKKAQEEEKLAEKQAQLQKAIAQAQEKAELAQSMKITSRDSQVDLNK